MLNQVRFMEHDEVDADAIAFVTDEANLEEVALIHAVFMADEPTVYRQRHDKGVDVIGPWYCDEQARGKIYQILFEAAERYQKGGE